MINILITGGTGQLGRCLISEINKYYTNISYDAPTHEELDIKDFTKLDKILANKHYDFIINCAAYTDVPGCEKNEEQSLLSNSYAPKIIASACARYNIKFIHISTDYVYDGSCNLITEDTSTNPLNMYGRHKLLGEQEIESIAEFEKLDYMIIRTSWVYSEYGKNFVKTIIGKITDNNSSDIKVVNDQIGSPTNAHDLAKFIITIINKNEFTSGIYHYSNDGNISWYDFAKMICIFYRDWKVVQGLYCVIDNLNNALRLIKPCKTSDYPSIVNRPSVCMLSKEKVKREFGEDVVIDWADSLEKFIRCRY